MLLAYSTNYGSSNCRYPPSNHDYSDAEVNLDLSLRKSTCVIGFESQQKQKARISVHLDMFMVSFCEMLFL